MDGGRVLDLADRYINNKTTKYLLRADCVAQAQATIALFTTHMTSSSSNYLTPANAFTVLALIGALRFPINKLGTLLGQLAQAIESFHRIEQFVGMSDEDDDEESKRDDEIPTGEALVVERGAFRYAEGAFVACSSRLDLALRLLSGGGAALVAVEQALKGELAEEVGEPLLAEQPRLNVL